MEFKKRILSDYTTKMNEILSEYRREYEEIAFPKTRPSSPVINNHEVQASIQVSGTKEQEIEELAETSLFPDPSEQEIYTVNPGFTKVSETVDLTLLESEFANSINQSSMYNNERRRRARRRTGRSLPKRKYEFGVGEDAMLKRRRTDNVENFLRSSQNSKTSAIDRTLENEYKKEIEMLRAKLKESEDERNMTFYQEKMALERIREENLKIAKNLENEMKELQEFKQSIFSEVQKLKEVKKMQKDEEVETRVLESARIVEAERSKLINERKIIEKMKEEEEKRLYEEKMKLERERNEQLKKIYEERANLEKEIIEQSIHIESKKQQLKEEREKMNQTFIDTVFKPAGDLLKTKDVKIQLPVGTRKETVKSVNEVFQEAKREHIEKVNQSLLVTPAEFPVKPSQPKQPVVVEKLDPHHLYKKSIDAQSAATDPKKYVPKTIIPFYQNEEEFESVGKKFEAALFTKDPRLCNIVKSQDHGEIRDFFGNKKEIDVEMIFDQIENVSNYSPNKLRRNN